MKLFLTTAATSFLLVSSSLAQGSNDYDYGDYGGQGDYQDYQEYAGDYGQDDNLYHDYAQRQQNKA